MKLLFIIETKYLSPTNARGSRIKAWFTHDSKHLKTVTVPYDHSLSCEQVFLVGANALIERNKDAADFVKDLKIVGYTSINTGYLFIYEHGE